MTGHALNKNYFKEYPLLSKLALIFILISSTGLFVQAITSPIQNWDLLGYAASAFSIESTDAEFIHDQTYQQYKAYATDYEYKYLTEGSSYRKVMSEDAEAFQQQIPFYKIRIIFVLLILALVKVGVGIFSASHMIAAAFTCAGLLVFYAAYRKIIHPVFWFIVPLFFILFDVAYVAKVVTADSIAFFWVALTCYAFIHKKWTILFLSLIASVLIRTDLIVLVTFILSYLFFTRPQHRMATVLTGIATLVVYILINKYAGNYGWSTVFHYAIVSDMQATHPAEYSLEGVSVRQYLAGVVNNFGPFFSERPALLFKVIVFIQFILVLLSQKVKPSLSLFTSKDANYHVYALTIISVAYVIIHYLLFPLMAPRFFVGQYMIAALGFLAILSSLVEKPI